MEKHDVSASWASFCFDADKKLQWRVLTLTAALIIIKQKLYYTPLDVDQHEYALRAAELNQVYFSFVAS